MSEFRRKLMMARDGSGDLPAGYTRLQYIYNTSNAYIDTGVLLDSNDTVDTQWEELTGHNGGDRMICGILPNAFSINLYYGTINPHMAWGASGGFRYKSPDQRVRVERGMFYAYRDGVVIGTYDKTPYTFTTTKPLYLFCWNNGNNVNQYPLKYTGIKYFTIEGKWNGISCTDPNGVVGMYDIVNGNFHTSPNGTAFIAGPLYEQ